MLITKLSPVANQISQTSVPLVLESSYANQAKDLQKLVNHTSNGIFIWYTATTQNVYYDDNESANVKMGTHTLFDEAHFTVDRTHAPLAAQFLQHLGYIILDNEFEGGKFMPDSTLKIKLLSDSAKLTTQSTTESIDLDLYHLGATTTI